MKRRLLLDSEVVDYLERLRTGECDLAVHVFHGHAILYWDDFADRHLKVLEITNADDFPA